VDIGDLRLLSEFEHDLRVHGEAALPAGAAKRLIAEGCVESVGIALRVTEKGLDALSHTFRTIARGPQT
jgi:hypothetical protein